MTSKIKVDNINKVSDDSTIIKKCGTTTTVGSGSGQTIVVDGATVTLGRCGGAVNLASGATQSGFGRTGTVDWCTTAKTSPFTSASGNGYFINTSGGAVTVTLPASPSAGDIVGIKDYAGTWGDACKAVTIGRNSSKLDGSCADSTRDTANESLTLVYVDGTQGWKSIEESTGYVGETFVCASGGNATVTCGNFKTHIFTADGTFTVNSIASSGPLNVVDYMVVAGAGGGGSNNYGPPRGSGGGGAGGMRFFSTAPGSNNPINNSGASPNVSVTVTASTGYPITVGGGGAGAPSGSPDEGSRGNDSIFSSVTSAKGGAGGGHCNMCNRPGGSGGGARNAVSASSGNTPPVAPPQGQNGGAGGASSGNFRGSGGGGAGGAGIDGDTSSPDYGAGGVGAYIADPFIGPTAPSYGTPGPVSSTRYFAGGGSGSPGPGSSVNGPIGGGGGGNGAAGTANTGGGGGANPTGSGAAGGSGIVMIRYRFQ